MTNAEKYKTIEERVEAFSQFCHEHIENCICPCKSDLSSGSCEFLWLDLEADEEKPLPCPFCGNQTYVETIIDFKNISCSYCGMKAPTHTHKNDADAIAEFNRVARAVMAAKESEVAK